jgi:four helix bundle protein
MFDFEKLEVYQLVRETNLLVIQFLYSHPDIDVFLKNEWKQATFSMQFSLAEGSGKMTIPDKKNCITLSRGFNFQCVSIMHTLKDMQQIDVDNFDHFYNKYESISKMLLGMYRSFK